MFQGPESPLQGTAQRGSVSDLHRFLFRRVSSTCGQHRRHSTRGHNFTCHVTKEATRPEETSDLPQDRNCSQNNRRKWRCTEAHFRSCPHHKEFTSLSQIQTCSNNLSYFWPQWLNRSVFSLECVYLRVQSWASWVRSVVSLWRRRRSLSWGFRSRMGRVAVYDVACTFRSPFHRENM